MALQLRPGDRARPTKDIDPLVEPVEYLVAPALLSFAEFDPVIVPCYPISQQLAEKWDAYVRTYASGASSQIKDFIDIVLFAEMGESSGQKLTATIKATSRNAGDMDIPHLIPSPTLADMVSQVPVDNQRKVWEEVGAALAKYERNGRFEVEHRVIVAGGSAT
jgi:hypothetical protein